MGIGGLALVLGIAYLIGIPCAAIVAFFRPPKGRRAASLARYCAAVGGLFLVSWWVPVLHAVTWTPLEFAVRVMLITE